MGETIFEDRIEIQGSQDAAQLKVQGNVTQEQPLQSWQNNGLDEMARITGDGRLQIGDLGVDTPDALIEAHRDEPSGKPVRGFHSLGRVAVAAQQTITWIVQELELLGSGGVSGLQAALRAKLTHDNTGTATNAELRAGDFQGVNKRGSSGSPVGRMAGVRGAVSNSQDAFLNKAAGVEATIQNDIGGEIAEAAALEVIVPVNDGTIDTLYGLRIPDLSQVSGIENAIYAIHTNRGVVHFEDVLELKLPAAVPGDPPQDVISIYGKADGKLYAKNWGGTEFDLTGGGSGGGSEFTFAEGSGGTTIPNNDTDIVYFNEPDHTNSVFYNPLAAHQLIAPAEGLYLFTAHIAVASDPRGDTLGGNVRVQAEGENEFGVGTLFFHNHYCQGEYEDFTVTGAWYADQSGRESHIWIENQTGFDVEVCLHWAIMKVG